MRAVTDLPDFDMHGEGFAQDPLGTLAGLRERAPMARTRRGIEVLDYDWNSLLYADRRLETPGVEGLLEKGVPPTFEDFLRNGFLLGFHGERHDLVRRVIQKGFTIREIEGQRARLRALADELVDQLLSGGTADLVADFTMKFPVISICRMLGVPEEDIPEFREAGLVLHLMGAVPLAPGFPQIEASLAVLRDYVARLVERRRAEPGDDFISALIEAQETEGRLTESELVWNIANLLFAAQDTTRFQLAGVVRAAIEQPGETWERLAADPALVSKVLWEGMRFHPAVRFSTRRALEDFEVEGFSFAKGQWVFLHNLAATRDPAAFPDPDRYDIDRKEQFALPFGRGLHHCAGQMLARIGMEESLFALSSRLTDFRLAGPVTVTKPTAMVGGAEAMPVRFRAR